MAVTESESRGTAANQPEQRRTAGALLVAGPAIYLVAEFVAAAAWTDPGYSYTHHFISDLGVRGPSTLFGQYMYSPLAWVMNTGFFLFGIVILAGVAMLRGLNGARRWAALVPAGMLAVGGVLLALFHGSGEALTDGTGEFHSLGAFAGFTGANVLAMGLGRMWRRIGVSRDAGRGMVVAGVVGLVSTVAYLAAIMAGGDSPIGVIGLIERGAAEPFLVGLLCAGVSMIKRAGS
ncbi:DUF998 domain-containing protein [Winogradskya humida]|uniref:DUF998 domain-containing protein n=1 Tax=Winogradskya humida TaxID=113566 RepID=A0ABQ3ZIB2_9ACTN|nr:DUF998 domain-containing protein [Actinoplanes humidus]GIE17977.1 hypothetical protein Ahu01nite_010790 [Actinoplanes humidus]